MKLAAVAAVVAQSERIATFIVYQPDGEPYRGRDGKPATFSHTGSESKAYRMERERIQRKALNQRKRTTSPADLLQNRVDLASAPVTGWTGWEGDGDEDAPCTPENVKALLAAEHILVQLEQSIEAHADFFTKPSPT